MGPYEILERIGAGGMGEVYCAKDTRLDRIVAVKVLFEHADARRLEQEARAISGLSHSNICTLFDVGQHNGAGFLVMEHLEGETLAARLKRGKPAAEQAMQFAREILDGLDHAHRRGVIHRDLKPANVMLVKSGGRQSAKLLDFGLAKISSARDTTETLLTEAGMVAGTLRYMAPEQLEGRPADIRSDIYACGLVLQELLPHTETAAPGVLKRCLAEDPEERWQSVRDLRAAFELACAPTPKPESPKRHRLLLPVAAALLVVLAAIAFWPRPRVAPEPVTFTFEAPAGAVLIPWTGVPSPDGQRIAFVAQDASAKPAIWIRSLHSQRAERLAGTEGAVKPFWSPDGKFVGFFAEGKLKKVALAGGPAVNICNAAVDLGASWSASGDIVFAPFNRTTLFRVSAAGGTPQAITTLNAERHENSHRFPHFLPDGRHFFFTARSSDKESTTVYLGSLDSKETKRLFAAQSNAQYAPPGYLLFAREGTLMAQAFDTGKLALNGDPFPVAGGIGHITPSATGFFSVSGNGSVLSYQQATSASSSLAWFNRKGESAGNFRQLDRAGQAPGELSEARLSPDGKRIAVVIPDKETGNRDIWLMEAATGAMTRFTFNPANDWVPVWSPDGAFLAFASDRNAKSSIYRKAVSGSGEEEMLVPPRSDGGVFPRDWSPDGRFILYNLDQGSQSLWLFPVAGERKPVPILSTSEFLSAEGRLSPDGKWVAYVSRESGTAEVYVKPVATPGKIRVSSNGGAAPRWRRDGKEIFYMAPGDNLMAAAVTAGDTFEAGPPKPLFQTCGANTVFRPNGTNYEASPDGNRFLMVCQAPEANRRSITVSINWLAALPRP